MRLGLLTFYFRSPKGSQKILLGSSLESSFNLVTLTVLLNSGIRYLYPIVLLALLISLNLTYSIAIRLLFVQTMTSLTLTPGSRSAANAVAHVIFY